jgi:hypothetical protein
VPVHVIASRKQTLERLRPHGFRRIVPEHPAVTRMHQLLPVLLDAFGERERSAGTASRRVAGSLARITRSLFSLLGFTRRASRRPVLLNNYESLS